MRGILHGNTASETAIAQIGPVVDAAVVDQDNVVQAVTGHISQADPARRIVEIDIRKLFQVENSLHRLGGAISLLSQAFIPQEMVVPGHEDIGAAVTGKIHQANIWVVQAKAGILELLERLPSTLRGGLEEAGDRFIHHHQIRQTVATQIGKGDRRLR